MILTNELIKACDELFDSELGNKIYADIIRNISDREGMSEAILKGTVIGFSGGADSVLLLIFLRKLQKTHSFKLKAVHVNHLIRGDEATRDEQFSKEFCALLGIPFAAYQYDVPRLAKKTKKGLEETARAVRYEVFRNSLNDDFCTIATAHNATDNTETFMFNVMRGTGTLGLTGISPIRDNIVRPLLTVSKKDISELLNEKNIPFCVDNTNFSCEYSRNYIRHEILPKLNRLAPNPDASVAKAISNLRCDMDFIDNYASDFFELNYVDRAIRAPELRNLHKAPFVRVIKRMLCEITDAIPEKVHFDEIFQALKQEKSFEIDLPGNVAFYCKNELCYVDKRFIESQKKNIVVKLKENDITEIPELDIAVGISDTKCKDFSSNGQEACGHQRAHEAENSEHGADRGPDHQLGCQLFIIAHLGGHHRAGYCHRRTQNAEDTGYRHRIADA